MRKIAHKLLLTGFLIASLVQSVNTNAAEKIAPDCKYQISEKNIITMCLHKGSPFQHDRYSLTLNRDLIFVLADDYVENIRLDHVIPEGPAIELPFPRKPGQKTMTISGGCLPVVRNQIEVARKCDFYLGTTRFVQNVWFDFDDEENPDRKQCYSLNPLLEKGNYIDAKVALDTCIRNTGKDDFLRKQAYIQRAWVNYSLKNFVEAVRDQYAAFNISSAQSHAELINSASYLRSAGKLQDSLDTVYQAELIDKLHNTFSIVSQYHIGWNLQLLGQYEKAITVLTQAIPAQPEYPFVYFRRGLSYEGVGNKTAARADFETVRKLMKANSFGGIEQEGIAPILEKLAEYGIRLDDIQ